MSSFNSQEAAMEDDDMTAQQQPTMQLDPHLQHLNNVIAKPLDEFLQSEQKSDEQHAAYHTLLNLTQRNPEVVGLLIQRCAAELKKEEGKVEPLLECLLGFTRSVEPMQCQDQIFALCITVINHIVNQETACLTGCSGASGDCNCHKDYPVMVALDLLHRMVEILDSMIAKNLIGSSIMLPLLRQCMRHPFFGIRLTAFGLLIETSKAHFEFVEPYLTDIMPILGQNLHIDNFPVCCNAMNALDEIIVKLGVQIEPYIPYVLEPSVNIINVQDADEPLLYQTAIVLGRLGLFCPQQIAPLLPQFFTQWCSSIGFLLSVDGDEKVDEVASITSAFRGMCCMLMLTPEIRQRPEFKVLLESAAKFKIQEIDLMIAELTAE